MYICNQYCFQRCQTFWPPDLGILSSSRPWSSSQSEQRRPPDTFQYKYLASPHASRNFTETLNPRKPLSPPPCISDSTFSTSFHLKMAATAVESAPVEAPSLLDYVLDPNATLKDDSSNWRHGRAPDYSQTRKVYEHSTSISSHHYTASIAIYFSFYSYGTTPPRPSD
jgi:hypothetical protein